MGVDTGRPPLPAPTESVDETSGVETEVATTLTTRTDKTSYEVPEDGSPITISTRKVTATKDGHRPGHHRQKSQTSLLIEYFEGSKSGDKSRRPSVRVKVTPSATKKGKHGTRDAVQITEIGKDRKPSYTRRISLSSKNVETGLVPTEGTEISHSSESNLSGRPPVEIEVLNYTGSDMSTGKSSRGLQYAAIDSNISSMPPDSLLDETVGHEDDVTVTDEAYLAAPAHPRSRTTSQERIAQRVAEKLTASGPKPRRASGDRSISEEYDEVAYEKERRKRASRSRRYDDDLTVSGVDSSLLSSQLTPSQRSYRSGSSQDSRVTNNSKLLNIVEDTIKRVIMPEIRAIKDDQRADRNMRSFESSRTQVARDGYETPTLERRVSKSSSSPNMSSKPKVVLNRDADDPGIVLSRGDSERKKSRKSSREYNERPSSRRSSGRQSYQGDGYDEEERVRSKSSKSHTLRDAAGGALVGGILTAAALKARDSESNMHERRRDRKSRGERSRSASIVETTDEAYTHKEEIPPMPMASNINDSDVTRDSIVSSATTEPLLDRSEVMTPVREVSRGSVADAMSPVAGRTPTRTPVAGTRGLGMSQANYSIESPNGSISNKARVAALAAAGLGGAVLAKELHDHHETHVDADGYGETTTRRGIDSPAQSVSSLKKQFEEGDALVPQGLRPRSAASRSSAGKLREVQTSQASLRSSPTTQRLAQSRQQSQNISGDEYSTPLERPEAAIVRDSAPGTPTGGESVDQWYERQHKVNDRYRRSLVEPANRDSYQTNPFPDDDRRFTQYSEYSYEGPDEEAGGEMQKDVRGIGAKPILQNPADVESNVASLMEPSMLSSGVLSSSQSPTKMNGTYANRMAEKLRELDKDGPPAMYEGSTLSQTMPSPQRWAAITSHARNISGANSRDNIAALGSPQQSPAKSLREGTSIEEHPIMVASGLPVADDPMPEIGHFDDTKSEISTNPSIIHGPLGGDITGKSTWPYTPEPPSAVKEVEDVHHTDSRGMSGQDAGFLAAAASGAVALAAARAAKQATVEDERDKDRGFEHVGEDIDREATPTGSPAVFRDEGYATDARGRSTDALTPEPRYSKKDLEEYQRAMDAHDHDPFTTDPKHMRHVSGGSHGMSSPLYDSATGKGRDRIQSKDIVALMDHLTVRDNQRNARDTEILVTLVRTSAEMRQSFDEMKQFIREQDRLIMANTDRDAEQTVQKVLSGPRPQPLGTTRTPRRDFMSQEDIQAKRKGVLRRALKGLTGGRRAEDLARVEEMLMQILDNVEDLKHGGLAARETANYTNDTLDSYEKLRAAPDSGYEPEGRAGTSSTPSRSGEFATTPRFEKQQFHSGYDGRRGSINRVSTVLEGDEDEELTPDEDQVLKHQFENNERLLTPTQETIRHHGQSPNDTPYHGAEAYGGAQAAELTPKSAEKQRKHKSNNSSIFGVGVPKISRWSKTTSSSAAPDPTSLDSPSAGRGVRPLSADSRRSSQLDEHDDDHYERRSHDHIRSKEGLGEEHERPLSQAESRSLHSRASKIARTPSPLVPSEASINRDVSYDRQEPSPIQQDVEHEFDGPKYHSHRNSILLQHPQPRQGTTGRHQNNLETQAEDFDDPTGTNSDVSQRTVSDFDPTTWGSSGTAALARNRLSQADTMSPISARDDGPLIPQQQPQVREPEGVWEPQFSNSGFSRGGYYASPYGSGHLLEPIEEVRYSLETDSGHLSPEPQMARAVDMRSPARKITGPRPMGSKSPGPGQPKLVENTGSVRRTKGNSSS